MTGCRPLGGMTLRKLIERKARDYGYGSVWKMCKELGFDPERLYSPMRGDGQLGIDTKRRIVRELDVSPEILERVARR